MASRLPNCPGCGVPADPRWWYRNMMFCDGCCPDSKTSDWVRERMDYAVERAAECDRLRAALEGLLADCRHVDDCNCYADAEIRATAALAGRDTEGGSDDGD